MSPLKFCLAFSTLAILLLTACTLSSATPTITMAKVTPKIAHMVTEIPTPLAESTPVQAPPTVQVSPISPSPTRTIHSAASAASASPTPNAKKTKPTRTPQPTPTRDGIVWAVFPDQMNLSGPPFRAAIQNFENGFMIWRSDVNCVYAIYDRGQGDLRAIVPAKPGEKNHPSSSSVGGYCLMLAPLIDKNPELPSPPAGQFYPSGALGKVWNFYFPIQRAMGYATAPELSFTANYPTPSTPQSGESALYYPQMTLPNGKLLACEFDSDLQGYCVEE